MVEKKYKAKPDLCGSYLAFDPEATADALIATVNKLAQHIKGVARMTDIETLEKLLRLESDKYEELEQRVERLENQRKIEGNIQKIEDEIRRKEGENKDGYGPILAGDREEAELAEDPHKYDVADFRERLQADEEPMPCPVCGGDMEDLPRGDTRGSSLCRLKCQGCNYNFGLFERYNRREIVRQHNAICRDVQRGRECKEDEADLTAVYFKGVEAGKDKARGEIDRLKAERDELAEIAIQAAAGNFKDAREWVEAQGGGGKNFGD